MEEFTGLAFAELVRRVFDMEVLRCVLMRATNAVDLFDYCNGARLLDALKILDDDSSVLPMSFCTVQLLRQGRILPFGLYIKHNSGRGWG